MKSKENEKWPAYSAHISSAIVELLDEESERYIGDVDLTQFFHALANSVPCNLYNKLTGSNVNHLQFNHIANQLVFQYSKKGD